MVAPVAQLQALNHEFDVHQPAALARIAEAGLIEAADAAVLRDALALWQALQAVVRLTIDPTQGPEGAALFPEPLKHRLAAVGGAADFAALEATMRAAAEAARAVFHRLIEAPGEAGRG